MTLFRNSSVLIIWNLGTVDPSGTWMTLARIKWESSIRVHYSYFLYRSDIMSSIYNVTVWDIMWGGDGLNSHSESIQGSCDSHAFVLSCLHSDPVTGTFLDFIQALACLLYLSYISLQSLIMLFYDKLLFKVSVFQGFDVYSCSVSFPVCVLNQFVVIRTYLYYLKKKNTRCVDVIEVIFLIWQKRSL